MAISIPGFSYIQSIRSLQGKFFFIVLPPILVCFLIFSGVSTYLKYQDMQEELHQTLESFMEMESNILSKPLWAVNYRLVETHVQTMLLHPHVSGIEVREYDTKYVHQAGIIQDTELDEQDIVLQKTIAYQASTGGNAIGSLTVVSQMEKIHKALWEDFLRNSLLTLFLVGAIMFSALIAYRYTIGLPLKYFLQGIKEAKGRHKPRMVSWDAEDELGEVIKAYNKLLNSLISSEQRFKSLAANLPGAVFQLRQDPDGKRTFSYISEGVRELLEISSKSIMKAEEAFDFLPAKQRQKIAQQLDSSITTRKAFDFETYLQLPSGQGKWVRFLSRPQKAEDEVILFDGIMLDVTEQKLAEQEKNDMEDQLRQSQKMEAIGRLTGGIAHDFNNLLQLISGNIQIMLSKGLLQEDKYLKEAENACSRAIELVRHLLTFSRKVQITFRELDINKLVEETVQFLIRTLPKSITLQTGLSPKSGVLHADHNQLEQVLINLANNAADAMPEGGTLVINTERINLEDNLKARGLDIEPGEYVLITLSDSGEGMTAEVQRYIFEPFFTTKEVGKGTGLGLASAYGIIKGHGGHMTCYSEPGVGTSFKLYLPIIHKETAAEVSVPKEAQTSPAGSENVLVVDDEDNILEMTSEVLADHGYTIFTAQSGEQALEICKNQDLDLIVLDLGMPGIGGEGLLSQIKELDLEVKVIITSGYANHKLAKDPGQFGAALFINKPYRFKELLNQIRNVLDGT